MKRLGLIAALGLAVAGCASTGQLPPNARSIQYELSPGLMGEYGYSLTIVATGQGRIEEWSRDPRNWKRGLTRRWNIHLPPERFDAFEAALRSYRPARDVRLDDEVSCRSYTPDGQTVRINWSEAGLALGSLVYDFGCDPETRREWADRLLEAPRVLGIRDFPRSR